MNANSVNLRSNAGMTNKNYRRGSNFERWLLTKLIDRGYDGLRSAGSHSSVDVMVWDKDGKMFAIQCKTSQEETFNLSNLIWEDDVRELTSLPDNITKVLCIKQYRLITQVVWKQVEVYNKFSKVSKWSDYQWVIEEVFNLNKLRKVK